MNPRPPGYEPKMGHQLMDMPYHSDVGAYDIVSNDRISGKNDGFTVTQDLLNRFISWLRNEEGTSEVTINKYVPYLRRLIGFTFSSKNDISKAFRLMGLNKTSYEALSRLLTFIEKKLEGYEDLVYKLRKAMPKKPRSKADTYVPPDSKVLKLRGRILGLGEPYLTIYNILVSTGCRVIEAYELLRSFDPNRLVKVSEEVFRYHIDLQRKSKNVLIMYLPKEVVNEVRKLQGIKLPHIDTIEKTFCGLGLCGKYLRKWFRQKMKELKIDPEIIEFIQGRRQGIGPTHYTDFIPLTDKEYINTIYPLIKQYLIT